MPESKPLIISVASGPPAFSQQSLVTLRSFDQHARPHGVHMVWLTGDMPADGEARCRNYGVEVVRVNGNFRDYGNRQRHWYMLQWLTENMDRGYTHVLTIDCRDVVIQRNPFTYAPLEEPGVLVSAEASPYGDCPWNSGDAQRMLDSLQKTCQVYDDRWPIVNGGHVAGPFRDVLWAQMTRFACDCRSGSPTDQATLGFLANWTAHWNTLFRIVPVTEPWIVHGHFYKNQESILQVACDGVSICNAEGEMYRLLHQWDRRPVPEDVRSAILNRYGKE